jgi:hypothetical protein
MGEYLRVRFQGSLGWSLLRLKFSTLLVPACSNVSGFQGWDSLQTFQKPVFFRVRTDIRARLELKVRHFPTKDSGVCGYLKAGMVVECRAIFGCWLQIKYGDFEAAWVVHTTGGAVSLTSPTKQKKSRGRINDAGTASSANDMHVAKATSSRVYAPRSTTSPSVSAAPGNKLDALNAVLKETRIVATNSDTVGQGRLQLAVADDDSSVNSLNSLGSEDTNKVEAYVPPKTAKSASARKKKAIKRKQKNLGIRQNVDNLLESGLKLELLYQLHPCIQRKLVHTMTKSPCLMSEEDLEYEDDEEEEFASMLDRFRNGVDTEDDAVALEYLDERVITPMFR